MESRRQCGDALLASIRVHREAFSLQRQYLNHSTTEMGNYFETIKCPDSQFRFLIFGCDPDTEHHLIYDINGFASPDLILNSQHEFILFTEIDGFNITQLRFFLIGLRVKFNSAYSRHFNHVWVKGILNNPLFIY
jgi:hypothetical protein